MSILQDTPVSTSSPLNGPTRNAFPPSSINYQTSQLLPLSILHHPCWSKARSSVWRVDISTRVDRASVAVTSRSGSGMIHPWKMCENGHDLTLPNAFMYDRSGNRRCRECNPAPQKKRGPKPVRGAFDRGMG